VCYVNPGGFPCVTTYQVVILAPLYPIAAEILLIGVGLDMIGLRLRSLVSNRPQVEPRSKLPKETLRTNRTNLFSPAQQIRDT